MYVAGWKSSPASMVFLFFSTREYIGYSIISADRYVLTRFTHVATKPIKWEAFFLRPIGAPVKAIYRTTRVWRFTTFLLEAKKFLLPARLQTCGLMKVSRNLIMWSSLLKLSVKTMTIWLQKCEQMFVKKMRVNVQVEHVMPCWRSPLHSHRCLEGWHFTSDDV